MFEGYSSIFALVSWLLRQISHVGRSGNQTRPSWM